MTVSDKKVIDEQFEGVTKVIHANFQNVHDKFDYFDSTLKRIELQTTKTNGRVAELDGLQHAQALFCQSVQSEKEGYSSGTNNIKRAATVRRQRVIQTISVIIMAIGLIVTAYMAVVNSKKLSEVDTIEIKK